MASIEADLEASEGATGVTSVNDSSVPASEAGENVEDEAPSKRSFRNKIRSRQQQLKVWVLMIMGRMKR